MTNLPRPIVATRLSAPTASRQLSIAFETIPIRGIPQTERAKIITYLANILLQAASLVTEGHDDDGH
jgi:hypothetical protein